MNSHLLYHLEPSSYSLVPPEVKCGAEGFVHLSSPGQLLWVLRNFFSNEKSMWLSEVHTKQVERELKWEARTLLRRIRKNRPISASIS
jgi:hypothetical protein